MSKIEINNLTVSYIEKKKSFTALKNVSFSIEEGEFVSVIGSSGCGKSTLLSILEGINTPTEGEILINGEPVTGTGADRGVVFQHYSLFPWMTARKNVAFGIKQVNKTATRAERYQLADEFLEKVGLERFKNKYPSQLSGGMQQRVAVVRGVINQPEVLFADEPTGALNSQNTTNVLDILSDLNDQGQTIVMVTHTVKAAERANRVIYLSDGVISDEIDLGPYIGDYKDESNPQKEEAVMRHRKLKDFLAEQGW